MEPAQSSRSLVASCFQMGKRWENHGKMGKLLGTSTMCSMCSVFYLLLFLCAGKVTLLPTNAPLFLPRYVPPRQLSWSRTRSTMVMAGISLYIYSSWLYKPTYNLGGASPCSWLVGWFFFFHWLVNRGFIPIEQPGGEVPPMFSALKATVIGSTGS